MFSDMLSLVKLKLIQQSGADFKARALKNYPMLSICPGLLKPGENHKIMRICRIF